MDDKAPENTFRIGVDLGGTKTEIIVLDSSDTVLFKNRIKTPRYDYGDIVGAIHNLVEMAASHIPAQGRRCIGIGIPGSINAQTGLVQNANTTCLIGRPLKDDIESVLNCPIAMDNDANCFTLAECRAGAAQGYGLVFGIIMGTGCGGGICINGHIRQGTNRIAGEWGHYSVDPQGAKCYCGNRGCVETKISGGGVEAAFYGRYGRLISMQSILQGFRIGDPECADAFTTFLDDYGRCLGGLISVLDPDAVVLGGGLSNIDELYTTGLAQVRKYVFHESLATPVLKNQLGDSAGVYGAAWIGAETAGT